MGPFELLEARRAIEGESAALAAALITDEQLQELGLCTPSHLSVRHCGLDAVAMRNKPETPLDGGPHRRQGGAMQPDSKAATVRSLDRINLRLSAATFGEIDEACAVRSGHVSRNTWITEAVQEKLASQRATSAPLISGRRAHG